MKDRIRLVMESEDMTPARFADTLQIGRPIISHILNGRNNPSLDVISRILSEIPHINAEWLISGKGSMYKDGINKQPTSSSIFTSDANGQPDLFAQNYTESTNDADNLKYEQENELTTPPNLIDPSVKEVVRYIEKPERKIAKIIIYYSDNTFEEFNP